MRSAAIAPQLPLRPCAPDPTYPRFKVNQVHKKALPPNPGAERPIQICSSLNQVTSD